MKRGRAWGCWPEAPAPCAAGAQACLTLDPPSDGAWTLLLAMGRDGGRAATAPWWAREGQAAWKSPS